jgi:glycosyltransferase involved in cell wall biosynthesis
MGLGDHAGQQEARVALSVVVPLYRGARFLEALVAELRRLKDSWDSAGAPLALVEVVFADDAAVDGSGTLAEELARRHDWIRVIHLSRNYGQHAATAAGMLHTVGDWVATLDEDLQHPPALLPRLLARAVEESADVVYAAPLQGPHQRRWRNWTSRGYKRLLGWLSGNPAVRQFNSFRVVRGPIARAASSVIGHDGYLDVILSWFTTRVATVTMSLRDVRVEDGGAAGYDLHRLLSHARRLLVSSRSTIFRGAIVAGLLVLVASLGAAAWISLREWLDPGSAGARGWTSLMAVIAFYGGLGTFLTGAVLEYLNVIVLNAQGKPPFFLVDRSGDSRLREWFARHPPVD